MADDDNRAQGSPESGPARRRAQYVQAQDKHRGKLEGAGLRLLQGFVPKEKHPRFRRLKAQFGVTTIGAVLVKLLEYWEGRNHHGGRKTTSNETAE
jgi:hypothetical protein